MTEMDQDLIDILEDPRLNGACVYEPRDRLDSCIVGVYKRPSGCVAVYDYDLLVTTNAAMMDDNTSEDLMCDAQEWVDFNTVGAYLGPRTPIVAIALENCVDAIDEGEHIINLEDGDYVVLNPFNDI